MENSESDVVYLRTLGIRPELIDAILDPQYEAVRATETVDYWVQDSVRDRWETLAAARDNVTAALQKLVDKRGRPRKREKNPRHDPRSQSTEHDDTAQIIPIVDSINQITSADAMHTRFFKGGRIGRFLTARPTVSTEPLEMMGLASYPPQDFSSWSRGLYLTKSRACALQFAKYAAGRNNDDAYGVLVLDIPSHLLGDHHFVVGDDWQQLIRACKGRYKSNARAINLSESYAGYPIPVGPISAKGNDVISRNEEVAISIMELDGDKPHQWVIQSRTLMAEIGELCREKCWIEDVTALVTKENS